MLEAPPASDKSVVKIMHLIIYAETIYVNKDIIVIDNTIYDLQKYQYTSRAV